MGRSSCPGSLWKQRNEILIHDDTLTFMWAFFFTLKEGGFSMWNVITHLFAFTGSTLLGIVMMCLMQAAGQEDK